MPPTLEIRALTRTYPATRRSPARRALDLEHLSISPGEWVALLGPNGSGKSTLVRILATLDRPDTGSVFASGDSLSKPSVVAGYRASLGVVFQNAGLDRLLTVRENLDAQGALHGLRGPERRARVREVAEMLGVADRLGDRVGALSGGLARRCDLARALLPRPRLLILDEATAGLDHDARSGFLGLIERLHASDSGALTILMTTHQMDEAERADRVVLIHGGRVVRDGSPEALRRAVGSSTIRFASDHERAREIVARAGLSAVTHGGEALVSADASALRELAGALAAEDVAFTLSPPTLGDAYLAATGRALTPATERTP